MVQVIQTPISHSALEIPVLNDFIGFVDEPSDRQMELVNAFKPVGMRDHNPEDVFLVNLVSLDSLINKRYEWWFPLFESMAKTYPGTPWMFDHDTHKSERTIAHVIDATHVRIDYADVPDRMFDRMMMGDTNRMIAEEIGYHVLILTGAFQRTIMGQPNPIIDALHHGRISGISTHCNIYDFEFICPIDGLPFNHPDCDYLPPWMKYWYDPSDKEWGWIAPYEEYHGTAESVENSFVPQQCFHNTTVPIQGHESGVMPRPLAEAIEAANV